MNEDVLNTSIRRFLKTVGVTSQREIEKAVREAVASGRLKGNEALPAKVTLTVGGINLTHTIEDKIDELIARKGQLASDLIRPDDPSLVKQFTREELDELLAE